MNMALVREWLTLDDRKRTLKAELETVQEEINKIEKSVQDEFGNNGIDNVRIDGRTVYIACDRWPRAKDGNRAGLVGALKGNNLAQYVKEDFNTQSLRGLTNEMIRTHLDGLTAEERITFTANDAIPDALRPYLEITEVYTVKSRKA